MLRRVNERLSWWRPNKSSLQEIGRPRVCPVDITFDQEITFDTTCRIWSFGERLFTFDTTAIKFSSENGSAAPATMDEG